MTAVIFNEGPNVEKAVRQIRSMLVQDETLEAWAIQRRLFSLFRRRSLVAVTSGRFIAIQRGLLGGFTPTDVRWQDLKEAKLDVGAFGASIAITIEPIADLASSRAPSFVLIYGGLRKHQTQEIYRLCQSHAQAWREKRRIRDLEEMRAKSGGIQLAAGSASVQSQSDVTGQVDPVKRLQQAKQMLDEKLISDSEYEAIKAKIVNTV